MSYLQKAQARANRRKSPWNILVFLLGIFFIIAFTGSLVIGVDWLHQQIYPSQSLSTSKNGFAVMLATLPLIFGAIPIGLICANGAVWLIPSARRALSAEMISASRSQHRSMLKFAGYATSVSLALSVVGTTLSW